MELKEVKVGQIVTNILHPEFGDGVVTGFKGTDKDIIGVEYKVKTESWSGAGTNTKPGYGWNSRASELKLVSNTVSIGGKDVNIGTKVTLGMWPKFGVGTITCTDYLGEVGIEFEKKTFGSYAKKINAKAGYGWRVPSNYVSLYTEMDYKEVEEKVLDALTVKPNRHNKAWNIAEEEFVQKYWETLGITETAQILERTEDAIRSKLYERG